MSRTRDEYDDIEISAELKHETEKAWLLHDGAREAWVAKSLCDRIGVDTFSMPEWLAIAKGFI